LLIKTTGSTPEPESNSRHLYAGRRLSSKQISLKLFPTANITAGFDDI
jgi:hypothetical protein